MNRRSKNDCNKNQNEHIIIAIIGLGSTIFFIIFGIILIGVLGHSSLLILPLLFLWFVINCICGCVFGSDEDRKDINDAINTAIIGTAVAAGSYIVYKGVKRVAKKIPAEDAKKAAKYAAMAAGVYVGSKTIRAVGKRTKKR